MKRFRSVVFSPLARNQNNAALRRILDLVQRNDATLTLFEASTPLPRRLRLTRSSEQIATLASAERELHQNRLNHLMSSVDADSANDVDVVIEEGNPAIALIRRVLKADHDLVVVTTDDDRLLRKSPCPVWVIRQTRARTVRVLAAVNPDPDEAELNRSILELARATADYFGGELHIAHAYELFAEQMMKSPLYGGYSDAEIGVLRHEEERAARKDLVGLVETMLGHDDEINLHVVNGQPAGAITDLVARRRINLLVLGTVGRSGLSGVVVGNTAETILTDLAGTDCSVVAVKPPGFVSPITA